MTPLEMRVKQLERENERLEDKNYVLTETVNSFKKLIGTSYESPFCFGLTTKENAVFGILMNNTFASRDLLMSLYDLEYSEKEIPSQKIMDIYICKIRHKVKPYGIEIQTVWGRGYRITDEMKARVEELKSQEATA